MVPRSSHPPPRVRRDRYATAWTLFRWRRVALTATLLGVVGVGVPSASFALAPPELEVVYAVLAMPLAALVVVALLHVVSPFEYPNCALPFARHTRREMFAPRNARV